MKTIRHLLIALASGALAMAFLTAAVDQENRAASAGEVETLRKRVAALERKLASLEDRLQGQRNRAPMTPFQPVPPGVWRTNWQSPRGLNLPLPAPAPPEHWGKGEFRGQPFYLIPAEERL